MNAGRLVVQQASRSPTACFGREGSAGGVFANEQDETAGGGKQATFQREIDYV